MNKIVIISIIIAIMFGGAGGGLIAGEIISKDDKGSLNDFVIDVNIRANGNQNSDGSITAQNIQITSQNK